MLRTVLFVMAVWAVVSVPVALLVGRIMAVGAANDPIPSLAKYPVHQHQRAA